jgi:hypothetical protein
MSVLIRRSLFLLALVPPWGCSTTSSSAPPPLWRPQPPLEPSSIQCLVAHRGELGLTDDQVARLGELEEARASADRAIEVDLEQQLQAHHQAGRSGGSRSATGGVRASRSAGGRGAGAPPPGSPSGTASHGEPPGDADFEAFAAERLVENDDQYAKQAEPILDAEQVPAARRILERYRQERARQRDAALPADSSGPPNR